MTMQIKIKDEYLKEFDDFINSLPTDAISVESYDDGYPSISFEEAKQRVKEAVEDYRSKKMQTISHDKMWEMIDFTCETKVSLPS
jgi:hypothetical protein